MSYPRSKFTTCVLAGLLFALPASAVTIKDDFTGSTSANNWKALDYACLTAGVDNGVGGADDDDALSGCPDIQDADGEGALRLTPAEQNKSGAILSNFDFPTDEGLKVTFTAYAYGGSGADGLSFFLTDGSQPTPKKTGTPGGSLGYSCSNYKTTAAGQGSPEGLANAYLGLGIDEFGNFLNPGDNTDTGIGFRADTIGLRGVGNVAWDYLNDRWPLDYPGDATLKEQEALLHQVCETGASISGDSVPNYDYIANSAEFVSQSLDNPGADTRLEATPIRYRLQLTPAGFLSLQYSYNGGDYQSVLTNQSISDENGEVPSSFRFGFAGSTGGSTNVHEITCFEAAPIQSSSSVGANTVQSGEVRTGTQVYAAFYNPNNWWGSVQARDLVYVDGELTVSSAANWDASCVLTADIGECPSTGGDFSTQLPAEREMLTADSGSGVAFQWDQLSDGQQATLNAGDGEGEARLAWLRGMRDEEQGANPPGDLRSRTRVLGDIINSSPTVVGAPSPTAFPSVWRDALYPDATPPENADSALTYPEFASNNSERTNVVYVGSNDGFLHGFRAGKYANGEYVSDDNDGLELLAFMPPTILDDTDIVDLTDPTYGHRYFVDAPPRAADLYYGGEWHTWLVGGLGTGGDAIYALNVTNPDDFDETAASSIVEGVWTSDELTRLGTRTSGRPLVERMHNGQWALIFGNGLGSGATAGIYIGLIDPQTGDVSFQFLDTGVGTAVDPNGISEVSRADLDGDNIVDYLYAGDLQGNVWRFDVTSDSKSDWAVSEFDGKNAPTPLFQTASGQPITTSVAVASIQTDDGRRVITLFGTGLKSPATETSPASYASGTQTFYGVWDWDMGDWNSQGDVTYAELNKADVLGRGDLLAQSVADTTYESDGDETQGSRYVSNTNEVCWEGSSACTGNNDQFGWYFDFPETDEQIIYDPVLVGNAVVVNTAIPPQNSARECTPSVQTGWTMAFDIASGGGLADSFFPDVFGSFDATDGGTSLMGIKLDGVGSPYMVTVDGIPFLVTQTTGGEVALTQANPQSSAGPTRGSWTEIITK